MLGQSWGRCLPEASFSGTEVRTWKQARDLPFQEELADNILSVSYLLLIGLSAIKAPQGRENPYFTDEETEAEETERASSWSHKGVRGETYQSTHSLCVPPMTS